MLEQHAGSGRPGKQDKGAGEIAVICADSALLIVEQPRKRRANGQGASGSLRRHARTAAAAQAGCTVTLRLDNVKGDVIGTATIKSTGSAEKYKTFNTKVNGATGVHDLYLCFDKAQGDVRLDYWQFK